MKLAMRMAEIPLTLDSSTNCLSLLILQKEFGIWYFPTPAILRQLSASVAKPVGTRW